jgi:hypothetical protein
MRREVLLVLVMVAGCGVGQELDDGAARDAGDAAVDGVMDAEPAPLLAVSPGGVSGVAVDPGVSGRSPAGGSDAGSPAEGSRADGGLDGSSPASLATAPASFQAPGGETLAYDPYATDGGASDPSTTTSSGSSFWDACGACGDATASGDACDSSDGSDSCDDGSSDDSGDSCDSGSSGDSGDSCDSGSSDGGGDACSGGSSDGSDPASCQVARRGRPLGPGTLAWLCAPPVFLLTRRRRR